MLLVVDRIRTTVLELSEAVDSNSLALGEVRQVERDLV
jgi:hypothetical protein